MHTLVVCDSEPIVMEGLRSLLQAEGLRVIAAQTSGPNAVQTLAELEPDILVLDKALGIGAVIECLTALRRLQCRAAIVVWGVSLSETEALWFLNAGATGVLRKTSRLDSVLSCLRTVAGGGSWMEADAPRVPDRKASDSRSSLTLRENQVMELIQQGLRNKEIAFALGIRLGTVKIHLKHIFEKTGIRGRYGLALSALKERVAAGGALPPGSALEPAITAALDRHSSRRYESL